eukprot:tig00000042_g15445.t1
MQKPTPPLREKNNWLIHLLYVRQDFRECIKLIEEQLAACNGMSEYPIFVKAFIKRQKGEIQESLQLFQAATCLNPHNVANLKQVGRSLYLLGKHKAAIDVYDEALRIGIDDWEIWHNKGLCYMYLKNYEPAIESFRRANSIQRHDATFMQLGKVYTLQENYKAAIDVYLEALEFSPENPEILTTIGLLYLRLGENYRAFDFLGNSLTHDPKVRRIRGVHVVGAGSVSNPKTILAAGSIIQDHSDMDVALIKYRVAAVQALAAKLTRTSASGSAAPAFRPARTRDRMARWLSVLEGGYVAAIACLKKALYLDPFEWIISYNLGLVHLNTGQYASAFHYFSASINLKPDFPSSYMYLAITLARLDDFDNACSAYEKAIEMERRAANQTASLPDHLFELNYAITLYNSGEQDKARQHFLEFERLFAELDEETRGSDPEVLEQRQALSHLLQFPPSGASAGAGAPGGGAGAGGGKGGPPSFS